MRGSTSWLAAVSPWAPSGGWTGFSHSKIELVPFRYSTPPAARLPHRRISRCLSRARLPRAPSSTSARAARARCRSPSMLCTQSLFPGGGGCQATNMLNTRVVKDNFRWYLYLKVSSHPLLCHTFTLLPSDVFFTHNHVFLVLS
jgi:hypothetical protein